MTQRDKLSSTQAYADKLFGLLHCLCDEIEEQRDSAKEAMRESMKDGTDWVIGYFAELKDYPTKTPG